MENNQKINDEDDLPGTWFVILIFAAFFLIGYFVGHHIGHKDAVATLKANSCIDMGKRTYCTTSDTWDEIRKNNLPNNKEARCALQAIDMYITGRSDIKDDCGN